MLREIGKISYGMYLFHMLCLNVVRRLLPISLQQVTPVLFLCTLALTVIVAEISSRTYERWFLRFKDRYRPQNASGATRTQDLRARGPNEAELHAPSGPSRHGT